MINKISDSKRNLPRLILISALIFLFARNLPLCFLMPIWSHGDEIGHMDYVLKLGRGRLPGPGDTIEKDLFNLHQIHYDSRYISTRPNQHISIPAELGLAQYSYEAHQPPLPYLILGLFHFVFQNLGLSLLLQVKLLRMITLLAASGGLFFIYLGLRRAGIKKTLFYLPLLFIPLLVRDMFFSVNTDCFSFFFSGVMISGMMLLFRDPLSKKNWMILSLGTILSLWTKVPNGFLFVLWIPLTFILARRQKNLYVLSLSIRFLVLSLILSSPWYFYNLFRFGNLFSYAIDLPFPEVLPQAVSLTSLKFFLSGLLITLFRGEFVWNGSHFNLFSQTGQAVFYFYLPVLIFLFGSAPFFFRRDGELLPLHRILVLSTGGTALVFCFAFLFVGGVPFYHARYAYGGLYFFMYLYAVGWRRLIPHEKWSALVPLGLLFCFNVIFTIVIIGKLL